MGRESVDSSQKECHLTDRIRPPCVSSRGYLVRRSLKLVEMDMVRLEDGMPAGCPPWVHPEGTRPSSSARQ